MAAATQTTQRSSAVVLAATMSRFESHCRRPHLDHAALVGVDRYPFLAVDRVLRTARYFRLPAGDAVLAGPTASSRGAAARTSRAAVALARVETAAAAVLVLVVECLEREPSVCLLTTSAPLGDVRIVLSHSLRFVDLQLSVETFQFALHSTRERQCKHDFMFYF